jgi:NAD(P)-dependent dehydrogenase (short-subunit alcohol dehydrogenase family)
MAYQIEQQFGKLDVLINNAAVLLDIWQNALNTDLGVVNQALTINLLEPWKLFQVYTFLVEQALELPGWWYANI